MSVLCITAMNNFLWGKVGFISTFKNRCLYVLMNHPSTHPIQNVFPRDLTPSFLFSIWHLLDNLLYLCNAYLQRYSYRLVLGFLLPPLVTFKKMFPSNLCSARNETEPWLWRNLIISSLENSPWLSLLGTRPQRSSQHGASPQHLCFRCIFGNREL